MDGFAAGMGAFGFWLMVAAVSVAGVWFPSRIARLKKEAELEIVRRAIEGGQSPEEAFEMVSRGEMRPEQKLRAVGAIVLFLGFGVAALGAFLGAAFPLSALPLYGSGALVAITGLGFLVAGALVGSKKR